MEGSWVWIMVSGGQRKGKVDRRGCLHPRLHGHYGCKEEHSMESWASPLLSRVYQICKKGWAATDGAVNEHRVACVSWKLAHTNSYQCHTSRHTTRRRDNGHTCGHRGGQSNNRWRVCGQEPEPKKVLPWRRFQYCFSHYLYRHFWALSMGCHKVQFHYSFLQNKSDISKI